MGGSSGSKVRAPSEDPDTLKSIEYSRILDLICEGEIEGLVNSEKSIYLNGTPLQNDSVDGGVTPGTYNFKNVAAAIREGTQSQEYIPSYSEIETEIAVDQEIKYGVPEVITITDNNLTDIRLNIKIPRLAYYDDDGNLLGTKVQYQVEMDADGGGYKPQFVGGTQLNPLTIVSGIATTSAAATGFQGQAKVDAETFGNIVFNVEYKLTSSSIWEVYKQIAVNWLDSSQLSFNVEGLEEGQYNIRITKVSGSRNINLINCAEWIYSTIVTINGKSTTGYKRSHIIKLPTTSWSTINIRVLRLTADSTSDKLSNKTFLASYTKIIDSKLTYPNSAIVGIEFDASQFSSLPTRAYDVKLLKIQIPSNYDPIARTYTGIWDGTFKVAWSDNPAWCFYDLITNNRYGLGNLINSEYVDKSALYTIGRYCDALVPSGKKDSSGNDILEPRFTCNLYLQTREEAYKVLTNMASIFRGMLYWSNNQIVAVQDSPGDVFAQFNNADVIDGEFNYEGSSLKTRRSVALVTWNDPENAFKQTIEYVEDSEEVALNGIKETEIVAVGCTSRGQAHRVGKWLLYTEKSETEIVTFKTGLEGAQVYPGKIIRTSDSYRAGVRYGGRIISATASTVTLDAPLTINGTDTYAISNVMPDGSIHDATITDGAGTYTTVNISPEFSTKGWELSSTVYTGDSFSISTEISFGRAIAINDLGDKIYVIGGSEMKIFQYNLTTPYDLSTASYSGINFSLSGQGPYFQAITFSNSGDRMFVLDWSNSSVIVYSLSNPWIISSASILGTKDFSSFDSAIHGLTFSPDGLNMYLTGQENIAVYHFLLSSPWDILSTVTLKSTYSLEGLVVGVDDIAFNKEGSKFFILSLNDNSISEYILTTKFDISTAVYSGIKFDKLYLQDYGVTSVCFSSDGFRLYCYGFNTSKIYEYSTETSTSTIPDPYSIWVVSSDSVSPEEWRVISVSEDEKNIFTISALEYNPSKYDDVELGLELQEKQVSLIDATYQAPPTNITYEETLYLITQVTAAARLVISWEAAENAVKYVVTWVKDNENPVTVETTNLEIEILSALPGTYKTKIIAYNSIGVPSETIVYEKEVLGLTAPPSDVTNFSIGTIGATSYLSWDEVPDLDVVYYQIRFAPVTSGGTWISSTTLIDKISKGTTTISVPSATGTYFIKAFDTSNAESVNAALVVTDIAGLEGLNVVATLIEDPTFLGDKDGGKLSVVSNQLKLTDPNLNPAGTYTFNNSLDLGAVYTSRVTADILASSENTVYYMSTWTNLNSVETLSGALPKDSKLTLNIRTTNDDPTASPTWSSWKPFIIGDYTARAMEFQAVLISIIQDVTPTVTQLRVTIDMPDRVAGEDNLSASATGTPGLSVSYTPKPFRALPALAISAEGLTTGDYYVITNKTVSGFDITFYDGSNVQKAITFDYVAKGYGYQN